MPVIALREMSAPHDGPMKDVVTCSFGTSNASASAPAAYGTTIAERRAAASAAREADAQPHEPSGPAADTSTSSEPGTGRTEGNEH
jgi:hypothetical protein